MNFIQNNNKQINIDLRAIEDDPFGRHQIVSMTNELGKQVLFEGDRNQLAQTIDTEMSKKWKGQDVTIVINGEELSVTVQAGGKKEDLSNKSCLLNRLSLKTPSFKEKERLKKLNSYMKELWKDLLKIRGKKIIKKETKRSHLPLPKLATYKEMLNAEAYTTSWKVEMGLFYLLEPSDLPSRWGNMSTFQKKRYLQRLLSLRVPYG